MPKPVEDRGEYCQRDVKMGERPGVVEVADGQGYVVEGVQGVAVAGFNRQVPRKV
jgi:hypothetical protein